MEWQPGLRDASFQQLCVWNSTIVKEEDAEDFIKTMQEQFNTRVKIVGCVDTLPGDGGPGGRTDLLFLVHNDDAVKFGFARVAFYQATGETIRWWEDVLSNMNDPVYPDELLQAYPDTWKAKK